MRILVLGSGGREHALTWKLRRSARVREVLCAPGNGGIEKDTRCIAISPTDIDAILGLVGRERIDLVVVGPEAPLAAGVADAMRAHGVAVVGPGKAAARLESSKIFAKEFMVRHGIPTAPFTVHADTEEALARLGSSEIACPIVIKADGLAAGKGVIVARTQQEAREAIQRIMVAREFGAAGDKVILEEFLEGTEASFIVFTDGETILPAVPAQDHKAAYDDDQGPNTGGMGAFSTDRILSPELQDFVLRNVVRPAVEGMRKEGSVFQGMLYAGLMLTAAGPRVLEFNVRMGDPEGQVILPRLESDFAGLCSALAAGRLRDYQAVWTSKAAVCVVLASEGYPGSYPKGRAIAGLNMAEEDRRVTVFHSGTKREGATLLTDGGRVLGVTALDKDLPAAMMAAYEAVNKIHFAGMHYRHDIGAKGLGPN
jgi:phosphoribosylamine--glycine ligase